MAQFRFMSQPEWSPIMYREAEITEVTPADTAAARRPLRMLAAAVVAMGLATGLAACGGGDDSVAVDGRTKGEALTDMKGAYDKGAITPDEYEEQREEILDE
ncbi:SHOCT domain-containing protein [Tistrella mobilis]|uniref:SHOCT domain-containing protein n=1 Tax=Tistrella mobilis TaxID=171437 RepID=UPI003556EC25